jgi:ABC-type branched-subunit amino acid transport system substrate-binding protein
MEIALANAQGIVADPEILCGVGHYDSDITIAASDTYHEAGLGFVAPVATAPLLTERSYLEVNRIIGRIDRQGYAAAQFASAQGFKSVCIVSQRGGERVRNAEYFRTEAARLGIRWLGSEFQSVTDDNRDRVIREILAAGPELIYLSTSSADQTMPLLAALRAAGYRGSFLGIERLAKPSAIHETGSTLIEGGGLYITITNPPTSYYPTTEDFIQDFEAQYQTDPLSFAARAYDATGICLKAIEEAARAKGGTLPTRAEVARAIRALQAYEGITGTYDFNRNGDPDPVQYYVYQVVSTDPDSWEQNPIVAAYDVTPP